LILVLEDLHWSDYATVNLIAWLARRQEPTRLLVLGTFRSTDLNRTGHPLPAVVYELKLHRRGEELALPWLTEAAVAEYLTARFPEGKLPSGLAQLIHQRTEGNPLFMITVIDAWETEGWLEVVEGKPCLRIGLDELARGVPETLRQMLAQQVERLGGEEQQILEAASVAGIEFSAAAVAVALDASIEVVETQCNALVRGGQFIRYQGAETWPDKTVTERYGFVHARYHETLYNRISANRRVRWHRQIGARLELGYGTQAREMAAELAAHFVRGQDVDRAVQYLRYAGEQALQRSAYQEASTHFSHGIELLPTPPDTVERTEQTIDLCLALRLALHPLGEDESVQEYLCRAEPLAKALGDDQRYGRVAVYRASCFRMLGDHESAMAASQRALAIVADDPAQQVVPRHLLGQSYYSMGEFHRAQELFRQNMALLTGSRRLESFGLSYLPAVGSLTYGLLPRLCR
jgi:predicted ATPase